MIVSTHRAQIPVLWMHEQAAVHLPTKGVSDDEQFLILAQSTFNIHLSRL